MRIKSPYSFTIWQTPLALLVFLFLTASSSYADEPFSFSGRLDLRGVQALENDNVKEEPSLEGRMKFDTTGSTWRFHSWLEGGWDGTVKRPARDASLFKKYDAVYQSNTPYFEFKELYVTHSSGALDLRAGIQRFAWGRLDEYPPNDLLNPWDYTRFIRKSLEDRKIGVPSISAAVNEGDWTFETVWVPVFVPYRLPLPDERWAGASPASTIAQTVPNAKLTPQEPVLPDRDLENGSVGLRIKHTGDIEWALNFFHGYDPRPVFKTAALVIMPQGNAIVIDPGYVPDFSRISVVGLDSAVVSGDWSIRAEAAYAFNRHLNIRKELWGYPAAPLPGITQLNPIEERHDTLDYGVGADDRAFEDGTLTVQAQQTMIFGNVDLLYERNVETIIWANLKAGFMNQKIETNVNTAWNPEHGGRMSEVNAWYVFSDAWKAGVTYVAFAGPPQSFFGRYAQNDQAEADLVYSW